MSKMTSGPLDGSTQKAFMNFLMKLGEDDTTPGLRIKPLAGAVDRRVRTGRVNDDMRAVLFKLEGGVEPTYVVYGVWPHDEGNRIAASVRADLNPVHGQLTVRVVEEEAKPQEHSFTAKENPSYMDEGGLHYSWLGSYGYTVDKLYASFGLPEDVAKRALAQGSGEDLLTYAEQCSGWIQNVLLQLSVGDSEEKIIEELSLKPELPLPEPGVEATDEQIVEALKTDLAKSEYTFVEGEEELRAIIESGSFGDWRRFLHPEQRRYVTLKTNGPYRLSGAAGTGKTVVLLHRAQHLADADPGAKIVLTTFGRTLAEGLEEQLAFLDKDIELSGMGERGVCVSGVDSLALKALSNARSRGNTARLNRAMDTVLGDVRPSTEPMFVQDWASAVGRSGVDASQRHLNPEFLEAEYEEVVLPHQIRELRQYLKVRRPGRGMPLSRRQRSEVWKVVEAFRAEAQLSGGLTYGEISAVAAQLMKNRIEEGDPHYADHVLIDEGQDLSAVQWQFLRGLVAEHPDDLFIAEDSQQRIYGHQLVLGHYGINIRGRSRRLTLNYRTTAQNLRRAVRALDGSTYTELEGEEVEDLPYKSARQGPEPVEAEVDTMDDAIKEVVGHVKRWVEVASEGRGEAPSDEVLPDNIGVLATYRNTGDRVADALNAAGIPARVVRNQTRSTASKKRSVQVMTMHRAKGLEFTHVVVVPEPMRPGWDPEETRRRDRSLEYVAMTRARDELVVVRRA